MPFGLQRQLSFPAVYPTAMHLGWHERLVSGNLGWLAVKDLPRKTVAHKAAFQHLAHKNFC